MRFFFPQNRLSLFETFGHDELKSEKNSAVAIPATINEQFNLTNHTVGGNPGPGPGVLKVKAASNSVDI